MKNFILQKLGHLFFLVTLVGCGGGSGSSTNDLATCLRSDVLAGSNCGCDLQSPVDLTQLYSPNGIWPFGVHGGGHPEGHPGWDFQAGSPGVGGTQQAIYAPASGHIYKIEADNSGEDSQGKNVFLKLDCGIQVVFTPMRPDSEIAVGNTLYKGQRIGAMSLINGSSWSVHFGTITSDPDSKKTIVCPSPFFSSSIITQLNILVSNATYSEKNSRTSNFTCKDSSTLSINLPAEPDLCAEHLASNLAAQIDACIQPENIQVW